MLISKTETQSNIRIVNAPIFLDFETACLSLTEPYEVAFVLTSLNTLAKVVNTDQIAYDGIDEHWLGYSIEFVVPTQSFREPDFNPEVCPEEELPF
jgi:hypothetical protein